MVVDAVNTVLFSETGSSRLLVTTAVPEQEAVPPMTVAAVGAVV
jgi:hypothetical protein